MDGAASGHQKEDEVVFLKCITCIPAHRYETSVNLLFTPQESHHERVLLNSAAPEHCSQW